METESHNRQQTFGKVIANLFQRLLSVFMRILFKYVIYGEKGQSTPPIKNLLLLEPASSLAIKIRTKKVCNFKRFLKRLKMNIF